jgi:hypothetical protein
LSPVAVEVIDWPRQEIKLNIAREQAKASPSWDPQKITDQTYEEGLQRHYGWLGGGI